MTPCPYCNEIRLRKVKTLDQRTLMNVKRYRVSCQCGYATRHSQWWQKRRQAKEKWETLMRTYEQSAFIENAKEDVLCEN